MNPSPTYYLVVDLEATCDDRGSVPRDESEIIEIGAVLVEAASLHAVGELQLFVRPIVHPRLTPFCTQLTTITQAEVDHAPVFAEAAQRLAAFGRDAMFCSWGAYDKNQLAQDARRHGVPCPLGPEHINIKAELARVAGRRPMGTRAALRLVKLDATGIHHRGIDDARNIARLLPYALGRVPMPG
jgi:inhibitor of KinA sporulation pathway (predicted exonuclease)